MTRLSSSHSRSQHEDGLSECKSSSTVLHEEGLDFFFSKERDAQAGGDYLFRNGWSHGFSGLRIVPQELGCGYSLDGTELPSRFASWFVASKVKHHESKHLVSHNAQNTSCHRGKSEQVGWFELSSERLSSAGTGSSELHVSRTLMEVRRWCRCRDVTYDPCVLR